MASRQAFVDESSATVFEETADVAYAMSMSLVSDMDSVPAGGLKNASLTDVKVGLCVCVCCVFCSRMCVCVCFEVWYVCVSGA